jgi:DNA-binding winged helix-turn-helix (wHTH) protein/Tol biopolymer transport system component
LFEVDRAEGQLYKRGVPLRIENHPFLILAALLERPGEIVTREELRRRIWRDGTNVGFEDGLNTAVRKLRSALGDSSESPLFIETVPRKGYRFVAPLSHGITASGIHLDDSAQTGSLKLVEEVETAGSPSLDLSQPSRRKLLSVTSQNRFELLAVVTLLIVVIGGAVLWRHSRSQRPASNFPAIQARKLEGAHAWLAALSRDGKYVAYATFDGLTSSVRLRQVANAGDVEILRPRKTYYLGLTFSPDGSELYFVRADEDNFAYRSLYGMPTLGGPVRKLIADVDSPVSFSPDGRRFVFARFHSATLTLEVRTANADGSGEDLLAQFPRYAWCSSATYATWSPDGRTIAVPFQGTLNVNRSSLYFVDVATRRVEEVYSGKGACIRCPIWTPDKSLIFSRGGDLWLLKDRFSGVRLLMSYDTDFKQIVDLSRDGKTAVAFEYQYNDGLWVVPVQQPSAPRQIISGDSPLLAAEELIDGRLLVTKQDSTIWTTKADGSDWQGLPNIRGMAVSCGRYIVARTSDSGSLVRFNEDGTSSKTLVRGPTTIPTCSLTGDAVFYITLDQLQQIMRVPIDGGEPVAVAKIQGGIRDSPLSVSPDGSFLAYSFSEGSQPRTGFAVLRASDGRLVKLMDGARLGVLDIQWAPDGRALHYVSPEDKWADVWEQPLTGGKPRRITRFESGTMDDFHWSRDGRKLLVVWGPTSQDLVLLSGLR